MRRVTSSITYISSMCLLTLVLLIGCVTESTHSTTPELAVTPTPTQSPTPTNEIDNYVKWVVGFDGPEPTDDELSLACQALQEGNWDYWSAPILELSNRTLMIVGAITTYASGNSLVEYCISKISEVKNTTPGPTSMPEPTPALTQASTSTPTRALTPTPAIALNSAPVLEPTIVPAQDPTPTPMPALTSTPTNEIEYYIKAMVGFDGPEPTDDELSLACQALQNANWDYLSESILELSIRTFTIVDAITTYASDNSLVDYCTSKIAEMGNTITTATPTSDSANEIENYIIAMVGFDGPEPTDDELSLACQALQNANWDYWSESILELSNRTFTIVDAITTYASGNSLVGYCTGKIAEMGDTTPTTTPTP